MIMRFESSVNALGCLLLLTSLADCGNSGAPPYAPETQPPTPRAAPAPSASSTSSGRTVAAAVPSDPHVLYDLREKCGTDARQWYQHFYEENGRYPKQSTVSHGFTSHYNARTNDCFAVTSSISSIKEVKSHTAEIVEMHNLANVLENKDIGAVLFRADSAVAAECHVAENTCRSRQEWESLTAPYMND
jgi:hypothetical protein